MAIKFARAEHLSRNNGGNLIRAAAYQMCGVMLAERTGKRFPTRGHYGDPETLKHHEVRLPAGVPANFGIPTVLWNSYDLIERRKNAALGWWMVLPLPDNQEISLADRISMVRGFVDEHFVAKGIPAQIDVHFNGERNWHAHILVPTRRLESDGIAQRKALDLDPQVRTIGGRRIVVNANVWGELWGSYQNKWFEQNQKPIQVDQPLHYPTEHLGPVRFQHPLDPKVQRAAEQRIMNLQKQAILDRVRIDGPQHKDRPAHIEDVARELSKDYAKQLDIIEALNNPDPPQGVLSIPTAVAMRRYNVHYRQEAGGKVEQRQQSIGSIRKVIDRVGGIAAAAGKKNSPLRRIGEALRDRPTLQSETEQRIAGRSVDHWGIKVGALRGELAVAERRAAAAFEKVRPKAEAELASRQRIARRARAELRQAQPVQQPVQQPIQKQKIRRGQRP